MSGGAHGAAPAGYRFGAQRIAVACDEPAPARWLHEFLTPWFAPAPATDARAPTVHLIASAAEYAQILKTASLHPLIAHITTLPDYTFRTSVRDHHLVNTNRLCRYGVFDVKGGKTGFINEAGYCVATWVSTSSRDVIAVILGARSNAGRFAEARRLIDRLASAPVATSSNRGI